LTTAQDLGARRAELSTNLRQVQRRVGAACRAAGRAREEVQLIVVTKFFPGTDIQALCELGVTDIGESRDQEASAKIAALPPEVRQQLQVHFIGQVQSRKAGSVATYADTIHSVDRPKLVVALDRAAAAAGRELGVLLQVSLDPVPPTSPGSPGQGIDPARASGEGEAPGAARGGILPAGVADLANGVAAAQHLRLRGLMAVAPLGADPYRAFAQLATAARHLRAEHPGADWISAGMSADLESAVANGATHLRVGSAILGSRPILG
jgi:uncharacterized pyridoxal phosphate-containing UPF0001 family protein